VRVVVIRRFTIANDAHHPPELEMEALIKMYGNRVRLQIMGLSIRKSQV